MFPPGDNDYDARDDHNCSGSQMGSRGGGGGGEERARPLQQVMRAGEERTRMQRDGHISDTTSAIPTAGAAATASAKINTKVK